MAWSRRLLLAALITAALVLAACTVHVRPLPADHHHHRAHAVVVTKSHVHGKRCGHYRYQGKWYHLRDHLHGPRCGHRLVRGVWVLDL